LHQKQRAVGKEGHKETEWDMVVVRLGLDEIMQPLQEYAGFFEHMQKAIAV